MGVSLEKVKYNRYWKKLREWLCVQKETLGKFTHQREEDKEKRNCEHPESEQMVEDRGNEFVLCMKLTQGLRTT